MRTVTVEGAHRLCRALPRPTRRDLLRKPDGVRRSDSTRTDLLSPPPRSTRPEYTDIPIGPERGDLASPIAVEWLTNRKVSRRLRSSPHSVHTRVAVRRRDERSPSGPPARRRDDPPRRYITQRHELTSPCEGRRSLGAPCWPPAAISGPALDRRAPRAPVAPVRRAAPWARRTAPAAVCHAMLRSRLAPARARARARPAGRRSRSRHRRCREPRNDHSRRSSPLPRRVGRS